MKLDSIFIFYPSFRYFLSSKIAGIKNINTYPLFKKKNLHLVNTAKTFVEKKLNITNCPTETVLHIDETDLKEKLDTNKKIIIPKGILYKNIQRQSKYSVKNPPSIGPKAIDETPKVAAIDKIKGIFFLSNNI